MTLPTEVSRDHVTRDGGGDSLTIPEAASGEIVVTDLATLTVAPASTYFVLAGKVTRRSGVWAAGPGRWMVEYDVEGSEEPPPVDPFPGIVQDDELPAKMAAVAAGDNAFTTAQRAAFESALAGRDGYTGVPVAADGHSFVASTNTSPGGRWWERLARTFQLGTVTNDAVGGQRAEEMACRALSRAPVNTRRLGLVSCITNNAARGDVPANLRAFQWAWRAYCSVQSAAAKASAASNLFAFSASNWVSEASANSTGGTRWVGSVGADFWFTYTDIGTGVDPVLIARPAGTGVVTFYDESNTALGTLDLSAATDGLETPAVIALRGLPAGRRTIRGRVVSGTAIVDSYRVPSTKPPRFLVLGEGGRDLARLPITVAGSLSYNGTLALLKTLLTPILADYPNFLFVDLLPGFDPVTMTQDGLHPNDLGASYALAKAAPVLAVAPKLPGTNVIFADFPLTVTVPTGPDVPPGGQSGLGYPAGSIVDTFTRADSTTIGTTELGGKTWATASASGTLDARIQSNTLKVVANSGRAAAFFDTGAVSTGRRLTAIVADFTNVASNNLGLILRYVDVNNYLYATRDSGGLWSLFRYTSGTLSGVGSAGTVSVPLTAGTELAIEDVAGTIKGYVNGTQSFAVASSDHSAATKAGLHLSGVAGPAIDSVVYG